MVSPLSLDGGREQLHPLVQPGTINELICMAWTWPYVCPLKTVLQLFLSHH